MKIEVYDPITLIVVWDKDYTRKPQLKKVAHDFYEETKLTPNVFNVRIAKQD